MGFRAVIMDHEESAEERAEKRVGALREALEAKYASLDAAMKQQALAQAKSIAILHDGVNALSVSGQSWRPPASTPAPRVLCALCARSLTPCPGILVVGSLCCRRRSRSFET